MLHHIATAAPSSLILQVHDAAATADDRLKPFVYAGFVGVVLVLLALDLGVFHKKAHVVGMREALGWTAIWVSTALAFSVAVYFMYDRHSSASASTCRCSAGRGNARRSKPSTRGSCSSPATSSRSRCRSTTSS